MLDLIGYTPDQPLHRRRVLEPSCGEGDFLVPILERLIEAFLAAGYRVEHDARLLHESVCAVEVHGASLKIAQRRAHDVLTAAGFSEEDADALCLGWLVQDDFLLAPALGGFDWVVGNPPYVRQERIQAALLSEYRRRFQTIFDRADLYVPFFERSLDLLVPGGALAFICANRWVKNRYGGPLRALIAADFHLAAYLNLEGVDAFGETVDAYPAITVIRRQRPGPTAVASLSGHPLGELVNVVEGVVGGEPSTSGSVAVSCIEGVTHRRDPWLLEEPEVVPCLRAIEQRLPSLEAAGAKVGIGVATGADRVFIGALDSLPVETERKLPLAMAADLTGPELTLSGRGVVNPWTDSGLVPLGRFPAFDRFVADNAEALKRRHVAKRSPDAWYRTIDRITPSLVGMPKLLIPDIKGAATVTFDPGMSYPHHNLYVVTSETWSLRALQAILRSSIALAFVSAYCVRMAGGFLRFQAQYLRRIRVPKLSTLGVEMVASLEAVSASSDQAAIDGVVCRAYGLSEADATTLVAFAARSRV